MKRSWDLIVVGGGPAGMTAAGRAAERGARVLLLEKNTVLGKKLLLTGGGRCNVTNATTDRHILTGKYGDRGVHLHSLFARFGPEDTRALLRRFGLETKVEAEGRVFPVTESAASVRDVLEAYMRSSGVTVRRGHPVTALRREPGSGLITAVVTARGEEIAAAEVALATGGSARPDTGSTGDAFAWLRELGVPVHLSESALVPIKVPDRWVRGLQGLALPDAGLAVDALPSPGPSATQDRAAPPKPGDTVAWAQARRVLTRNGKLLFTHFGLSGPLALNTAVEIREIARDAPVRLLVNPLPGADPAELERTITAAVATAGKRTITRLLREIVPPRVAEVVCELAGVAGTERLATLSRAGRRAIIANLTGMPCVFGGLMGQEKAVVSSGGVDPTAIDFRTMRVRSIPNLYVLGDLLDFNRQSGGYSLQVCWASGWVAGESVAPPPG